MPNNGYTDKMVRTIRETVDRMGFEDQIIKDLIAPENGVDLDTVLERAVELRHNRRPDGSQYADANHAGFIILQINTYKESIVASQTDNSPNE